MSVHAFGIGSLGVLGAVDARGFVLGPQPEAEDEVDYLGQRQRHDERVHGDDDRGEHLLGQLRESATEKRPSGPAVIILVASSPISRTPRIAPSKWRLRPGSFGSAAGIVNVKQIG